MSAQVKTVLIEAENAENAEDAAKQLREKLGGKVPSEVLDAVIEKITGERKPERTAKDALIELIAALSRRGDAHEEAEKIAALPGDESFNGLEELLIKKGLAEGLTREEAIARGNRALRETIADFGKFGLPERYKDRAFGDRVGAGEAKQAEPQVDKSINTKTEFDVAANRILSVHGRDAVSAMADFYQAQDGLCEAMQYYAKQALNYNNVAAAKLYLQLESYVEFTNRTIFNQCNTAGVDPEHLGFDNEQHYYQNVQSEKLNELRSLCQALAK